MEASRAIPVADEQRDTLFRYAQLAIRKLGPCARWDDVPAPVRTAIEVIRVVRGSTGHGLYWRGRPAWLTDERLSALNDESLAVRSETKTFPGGHHRWSEGRAHADALTRDEVRAFVEQILGRPLGHARATYNYYERAGEEAYAHVDQPEYAINILLMLDHRHAGERRSSLWVYPEGEAPIELDLSPGELVVFHAGSTVHQRTPVADGEHVRVVTAGYLIEDVIHDD